MQGMNLDNTVNQLTDLLSALIPTVDTLGKTQEKNNIEMSERRRSTMRLAEAIEKLVVKIDKL
jgi:hypothetical protein